MSHTTTAETWSLEVVRGRDVGRVFALDGGEVVLGNALVGPGTIDLSGQEDSPTRRMADRHASLTLAPGALTIRDLETPGGTFVNRQRVLPGQARPLHAGDVIQLGAVQLRVVAGREKPGPTTPAAAPGGFHFVLACGATCRSWEDFLAVSSQRWGDLRDELESGRLAAFVASIGRPILAPSSRSNQSPDERLDAWLGGLPTTRPAVPELDVHPTSVTIRVNAGGGLVRRVVRVSNVGHRLLRLTARVEPADAAWLKLPGEVAGRPLVAVEGLDLTLEVEVPEDVSLPRSASLVVESNGGTRRVAVTLEAKPAPADAAIDGDAVRASVGSGLTVGDLVRRQPPALRLATWPLIALALRLVAGVAGGSLGQDAMTPSGPSSPGLPGVAVALGAAGSVAGMVLAVRRGGRREGFSGGFAGGCVGVVAAAVLVAACRSVEPILGGWASSPTAVGLGWAGLGLMMAGLSTVLARGDS